MIQKTVNPYLEIGELVAGSGEGLDTIIAASPASIEDLVDAVTNYIVAGFYSGATPVAQ